MAEGETKPEVTPITCHVCGQRFATEDDLSRHLMEAHGDPGEEI